MYDFSIQACNDAIHVSESAADRCALAAASECLLDTRSANTDNSAMPGHSLVAPGYRLDDEMELDPSQMRVLLEPTRTQIIELLGERAATTSELADALGRPKGTIGHHCKGLEQAGLIRVVRTERVRAIDAKYYGRTARTFVLNSVEGIEFTTENTLTEAAVEMARFRTSHPELETPGITSIRYARIPDDRAEEWTARLVTLITEFTKQPRGGTLVYGLATSLFPTTKTSLPEKEIP